jgi:uncharacterized protein YlzI (FlbEa/FlbD family)
MAKRIAGVAFWKVDGRQLALRGNLTVSPTAFERTGIAGQDAVHGFSEVPRVPFIQGDVSLVEGTSVEDIDAVTDATITAELANGQVWVLRNAWRAQVSEINTREGQFAVRFEGESCTQIG